jgi:hypothetical protein
MTPGLGAWVNCHRHLRVGPVRTQVRLLLFLAAHTDRRCFTGDWGPDVEAYLLLEVRRVMMMMMTMMMTMTITPLTMVMMTLTIFLMALRTTPAA